MRTTSLNPEPPPTNLFWFLGEQTAEDEQTADEDLMSFLDNSLPKMVGLPLWLNPADSPDKATLDSWLQSLSQQND